MKVNNRTTALAGSAAALALALTACGGQSDAGGGEGGSGNVAVDGSSTVQPLTAAAAELFREENSDVNVSVATSGTGGGFEAFCLGDTDISNASRPISDEEIAICEENGVEYEELVVANDALTVVVNPAVDFVDCLTVEELNAIWAPDSTLANWSEVREGFPDVPLNLFGPGTDSGTFDYFTDAINGEEGASRSDYEASEDDNVLVQGVTGTDGAMGYFGFTYFEENADSLTALAIDGGEGCVAPSADAARAGEYVPLARPLFIYVSNSAYADNESVSAFVDFYVENIDAVVEAAQYITLNDEQKATLEEQIATLQG